MKKPEFEFKAGDKVRIHPAICRAQGLPERGWTVVRTPEGGGYSIVEGHAVSAEKWPRGVTIGWLSLFPDIDLPYDPKVPEKTLAEKELEVLQKDPIRRRWLELLGPQPSTEDFAVKIDFFPFKDTVDNNGVEWGYGKPLPPNVEGDDGEELWGFRVGSRVDIRGQVGTITHLSRPSPGPGLFVVVDMQDGSSIGGEASGVLWWAKPAHPVGSTRVENKMSTLQKMAKCYEEANETYRAVTGRDPPAPPPAQSIQSKFQVGDRVWDQMYASAPMRKGTVDFDFEGLDTYRVRWDEGGISCRSAEKLKPESDPGQPVILSGQMFRPEPQPFKVGDHVRRTDGVRPGIVGTITVLSSIFEICWDDGQRTAGAWICQESLSKWLVHA